MAARYATLASMGRSTTTLRVVAGVLPKLETIAAEELRRLGIAGKTKAFRGGIEFRATEQELWRVAHESRVVEFLRTRVANRSRAHDWGELYHRVVSAPWSAYLQRGKKGRCPSVSVSCDSGSKLYHEGAVRDRVTSTIAKRLGVPVSPRTPHNNNNNNSNSNSNSTPAESRHEAATAGGKNANRRKRRAAARSEQATANADPEVAVAGQYRGAYNLEHVSLPPAVHDVFVHIERNQVELAVNASGELLHKRGYRKHAVGSPIRETLAAACLRMAAGAVWADGDDNGAGSRASTEQEQQASAPPLQPPLWDPFCGSGTYVLEALDACVGLLGPLPRRFAFEFWPTHDSTGYNEYIESLHNGTGFVQPPEHIRHAGPPLFYGSDIAGRSVRAAKANFATALSTSPGGESRRKTLRRMTKFVRGDFEKTEPMIPKGATIVTNVPYGYRTESGEPFSKLYRRFGRMLQARPDIENVFVLTKHPTFRRDTGVRWKHLKSFRNGGLTVEWLQMVR